MSEFFPLQDVERFDLKKIPPRVKWYLRPIVWLLCFPVFWLHRSKIRRIGMKGVKPPYLLLCNHNAFYDFMVSTVATFPHQPYYVVAVDGFIGREKLMWGVGCFGKRKFTNDLSLIRNIKAILDRGKIVALYAEARYSLCGTNAVLPESLGKMVKLFKVPVVTLITKGHHVDAPFWQGSDPKSKMLKTEADFKLLLTAERTSASKKSTAKSTRHTSTTTSSGRRTTTSASAPKTVHAPSIKSSTSVPTAERNTVWIPTAPSSSVRPAAINGR
ncbi:MAG: hypothetical protein IJM05_05610 [Bacteroidales bacterium]|nr:hypothetical protein [Bacteroidales bacterium]